MTKPKTESSPNFTPAQTQAIYLKNKDIIVSAGAGSGKTTVLTKRLIEQIKAGKSVTDFLVVTFMNSAAADIKRKLYEALAKECGEDSDMSERLEHQLLLVNEANISTISSYCISFVKENFASLGISPRIRVADETESLLLLNRAAEKVMADGYEEGRETFLRLSDNFSDGKSDAGIVSKMISLFHSLRVTIGWKEMLSDYSAKLRRDGEITRTEGFFASQAGAEIKNRIKTLYGELATAASDLFAFASSVAEEDKYLAPIEAFCKVCENVYRSIDINYVNFASASYESIQTIKLESRGCDEESRNIIKDQKHDIAEALKKLRARYYFGTESFIADSFEKCADMVDEISLFLSALEREYSALKQEAGIFDYTDYEQKTLELLEDTDENGNKVPSALCLKKQLEFSEILIDEYQDVNPMQDRIFALLAGASHRFMVGDVKQSIYRFRNAYPDIFLGYKEEFADVDAQSEGKNARIFLKENFRCDSPIINYVNLFFQSVTENTPYSREYDGEWLVHASTRPELKTPVILAVAEKQPKMAKEARQAEADFIAREILDLVKNKTSDEGDKIKFSDCAVMLSAMKGYSIEYEKAFRKYGIPYKKEKSENFLENPTIRLAMAALKSIDDPTDDISLCALMRSPLFNFTSQDLYRIRLNSPYSSFWSAVNKLSRPKLNRAYEGVYKFTRGAGDRGLSLRCRSFVDKILLWRAESMGVTCSDFLKNFLVSSGLMRLSSAAGAKCSMLLLYNYACRFEQTSNHGLSGFMDYIAELARSGNSISDVVNGGENDAVSFITIHKSKGLEFKVCFVACTDREFQGMKNSDRITLVRREGITFRLKDSNRFTDYNPPTNIIAMDREREAIVGEELRKFYVALTRAQERLYVTGCAQTDWSNKTYTAETAKSWLDMALYVHSKGEFNCFSLVNIQEPDGEQGYIPEVASVKKYAPTAEMLDILKFRYPYEKAVTTAAKISVSELREGLLEDDEYNRSHLSVPASRVALKPAFARETSFDAGEIGTANHQFMQFCNFSNAEKDVNTEAMRLLERGMLTRQQVQLLDIPALKRLFLGDLYQLIKSSPRVYREKRFSVRDILSENGEPILVQGVIDCFFQNPDGTYTVVDYKTDRVKTLEELVERHKVQLNCYKNAVERMTGASVSKTILYSFALNEAVTL